MGGGRRDRKRGEGRGRRIKGRGGLSGNVAEEAFCLKSAPAYGSVIHLPENVRRLQTSTGCHKEVTYASASGWWQIYRRYLNPVFSTTASLY